MTMKTTSWTDEQQVEVDLLIKQIADGVYKRINFATPRIKRMDDRPVQTWTPEQPDVFFPYVNQAILEDLIAELQDKV